MHLQTAVQSSFHQRRSEFELFPAKYMCLCCFLVSSATRLSKLIIKEDGDYLSLTWTDPEVGPNCTWIYRVTYTECNVEKVGCRLSPFGLTDTLYISFILTVSTTAN